MTPRVPYRIRGRPRGAAALGVAALFACLLAAAAGDVESTTPYAVLHRALAPALAIGDYPRLRAVQRIESKLPGVPPGAIRLRIARSGGSIEIRPAADGSIDFPLDPALLAENPPVHTNQPRGSLVLSATLALAPLPSRRFAPDALGAALDDADRLLSADGSALRARGVELRFDPRHEASVTLHGDAERVLVADQAGHVVLLRDRDLGPRTQSITLSHDPLLMLPWLDAGPAGPGSTR